MHSCAFSGQFRDHNSFLKHFRCYWASVLNVFAFGDYLVDIFVCFGLFLHIFAFFGLGWPSLLVLAFFLQPFVGREALWRRTAEREHGRFVALVGRRPWEQSNKVLLW